MLSIIFPRAKEILFSLALLSCITNVFAQTTIYVSPTGDDNNNGSQTQPLQSLQKAISINGIQEIILQAGTHSIDARIRLNSQHQGLTIKGTDKDKVILSGGKTIPTSSIQALKNTNYSSEFPRAVRSNIYVIELSKLGINDYGQIVSTSDNSGYKVAPMEVFLDQKAGTLTKYPNDSTLSIQAVETIGHHGAIILQQALPNWTQSQDVWIEGYLKNGYFKDVLPVTIQRKRNKIQIEAKPKYGLEAGNEWNRVQFFNVKDALDTDGEYFIDRNKGVLFIYAKNPPQEIVVSQGTQALIGIHNTQNIRIENISFQNSRGMGIHMTDARDCSITNCNFQNLGSLAIWMGKYITHPTQERPTPLFGNVDAYYTDDKEIGNCYNNKITNCNIKHTGAGGIRLSGGNRYTLEAGYNSVEYCTIQHFNRLEKTYRAGVKIEGVGNKISHTKIAYGTNQAILLKGNEHIIEYNNIHDVCLEVSDGGALYYGRNPSERGHIVRHNYFHHIGNTHSNFETTAIYHDDGATGMEVYGNIFLRAGKTAVIIGGGKDNYYHNNLFLDGNNGIHIDNRLDNWGHHHLEADGAITKALATIKHTETPYAVKYPKLVDYFTNQPNQPQRNVFENNIFMDMKKMFPMGQNWIDFKDSNVTASGCPSIWRDKLGDRNFIPNDNYLPRPSKWKPLEIK